VPTNGGRVAVWNDAIAKENQGEQDHVVEAEEINRSLFTYKSSLY
tara:strand:- start:517 stop:651 length:135 start_codon:yes stop_codon:yes gene_type:complete